MVMAMVHTHVLGDLTNQIRFQLSCGNGCKKVGKNMIQAGLCRALHLSTKFSVEIFLLASMYKGN